VQVTAEEVEALLAIVELHSPRLVRVQLETKALQDDPDTLLGLLAFLPGPTHDHKVVCVSPRHPQGGAVTGPQDIEHVQEDVRQQGGVISPLLSNIYLHVLDVLWTRHSAPLGTLVRYCDDFVVICRTKR